MIKDFVLIIICLLLVSFSIFALIGLYQENQGVNTLCEQYAQLEDVDMRIKSSEVGAYVEINVSGAWYPQDNVIRACMDKVYKVQ